VLSNFVFIRNNNRKTTLPLTRIRCEGLFNKAGFSLLEFTIALLIIAALISLLIPKFNDLQDDAHEASVQLTANSLQSAVNLAHSLWQTQGSENQVAILKGFGLGNILMGNKGWPVDALIMNQSDSNSSTTRSVLNSSTCKRLWSGLLKDAASQVTTNSELANFGGDETRFAYQAEFNQGVCIYRYLLINSSWRIEYDLATGRVITLFK
jgi:type II secretory pathway pseudopilin PulG